MNITKKQLNNLRLGRKKGWKHSEITKLKISQSMKGKIHAGLFVKGISHNLGENHPNWKGGITSLDYRERRRFRMTIQKQVFRRDNYTCQMCGSKKDLQVDHIQSWKDYVELRFSMDNCRTLCKVCHYFITFGKPIPDASMEWGHNFIKGKESD